VSFGSFVKLAHVLQIHLR